MSFVSQLKAGFPFNVILEAISSLQQKLLRLESVRVTHGLVKSDNA